VEESQFAEELRTTSWGSPGWARAHQLPYVVIATRMDSTSISISRMCDVLGVDSDKLVFPYVVQSHESGQTHFEYPHEFAQTVLSGLIGQIEAGFV
jgi:hypothetical protein